MYFYSQGINIDINDEGAVVLHSPFIVLLS